MSVKDPAEVGASLDPATLQKLMAYADGELDGSDLAEIEALVKTNSDAARVLEELSVLGDCMRIVAETHPIIMPAGIADAVIARIHEDAKPKAPRSEGGARVIDLAARRRRTYGAVAGLVAAAAAVVMIARATNDGAHEPTAAGSNMPALTAPIASPPALAVAPPAASIDKPFDIASSVSVILVPSEGETASSVVIWLGEESPSGGPVK